MQGFEDLLDDIHWQNVQDPIKTLFAGISKTLRLQAHALKELDSRVTRLRDEEHSKREEQASQISQCVNKDEGTRLIYQIDTKCDRSEVQQLKERMERMEKLLLSQENTISKQAEKISRTQSQVEHLSAQLAATHSTTQDALVAYVDRQLGHVRDDLHVQIHAKADRREIETVIPARIEELFGALNGKVIDMRNELSRCVTKEEFSDMVYRKVDKTELRDLQLTVNDRLPRHEAQTLVTTQLKPLMTSITALERTVAAVDQMHKGAVIEMQEKTRALENAQGELRRLGIFALGHGEDMGSLSLAFSMGAMGVDSKTSGNPSSADDQAPWPRLPWFRRYLHDLCVDVSRELGAAEVRKSDLELALAGQTEYFMKQINIVGEAIRLEAVTSTRDELAVARSVLQNRLDEVTALSKDTAEKHMKTRRSLKDLSLNLAKALAKKVDSTDFCTFIDRVEPIINKASAGPNRRSGGGSPLRRQMTPSERVVRGSRKLLDSDSDVDLPENSPEDAETEFDYLLRSLKKKQNSKLSSPQEEDLLEKIRTIVSKGNSSHSDSSTEIAALRNSIDGLQSQVEHLRLSSSGNNTTSTALPVYNDTERLDWRLAVGDLAMALRREMSGKASRDELSTSLNDAILRVEARLERLEETSGNKAEIAKVHDSLLELRTRVSTEMAGAKFLWTRGAPISEGWIPWDTMVNPGLSPSLPINWEQGKATMRLRCPGLYRFQLGVFSPVVTAISVYINEEPCLVLTATNDGGYDSTFTSVPTTHPSSNGSPSPTEVRPTTLRRLRHSLGELCCLSLDQILSLPPDARLAIRISPVIAAQAFLSIRKV